MSKQSFSVDVVPFGLARFGFVELEDGDFLALCSGWQGSVSKDRGRTWSKPQPLMTTSGTPMAGGKGNASILRLASGRLGIQRMVLDDPDPKQGSGNDYALSFCTSEDEGRTWSEASPINRPGAQGCPYYDVLIQAVTGIMHRSLPDGTPIGAGMMTSSPLSTVAIKALNKVCLPPELTLIWLRL